MDHATYADLLRLFDPYHVTRTSNDDRETVDKKGGTKSDPASSTSSSRSRPITPLTQKPDHALNFVNLKPRPLTSITTKSDQVLSVPGSRSRPATPVIKTDPCISSVTSTPVSALMLYPAPPTLSNDTSSDKPAEIAFFSFIRNRTNKLDSDEENCVEENVRTNKRSLAFADVPLDGDFFLKVNVRVPCLPQQPSFEVIEHVQATVSDLVCDVLKTLDELYPSGTLSTAVGFELHCARTNECLTGNGKLGEYKVFTDAMRFSLEPVHLILMIGKQTKVGEAFAFSLKNDLTCQKVLERSLHALDDQLKFVSNPWRMQAADISPRIVFQNTAQLFREAEASLNLQHTAIFRRTASQFEKLASSVLQSQSLQDICRRSAKTVAEFVNAFAEAFDVPFQIRLNMSGNASSLTGADSDTAGSQQRSRFSLSLSSLHRFVNTESQLPPPIFVECSICDLDGNLLSELGLPPFTFEHKLMCSQPNQLTLISTDDEQAVPLAYLDNLTPTSCLLVRLYLVLSPLSESSSLQKEQPVVDHRKTLIGWANVPLFDRDGCLKSGLKVIPLWPSEMFNPQIDKSLCSCINLNDSTCLMLIASFHTDHPVYVQSSFTISPYTGNQSLGVMPPSVEERLYKILYSDLSCLSEDDRSFFWGNRHCLRAEPKALPIILWSAPRNSPHSFNELASFVAEWPSSLPGDPLSVLRLLLPELTNPIVTEVLTAILSRRICSDTIIDMCMPQFVHALRRHGWKLANVLIKRMAENHELSVSFYWLLTYEANNCDFICCRPFYSALSRFLRSRMTGTAFIEEISNQHSAVMHIMTIAEKIWNAKNAAKQVDLQRELRSYISETQQSELPSMFTFPCVGGADTMLSGLDPNGCDVLSSRAAPLRLKFQPCEVVDSSEAPLMCIVKVGDDLRNDLVALQLVRLMDYIWMSCQLDLRVITFRVLPTDFRQGIIEFVPDVDQLRVAQANGLSKHALIEWFESRGVDKQLDPVIVDTFTRTCAAWCVASYLIGVGDRHNDNILVHRTTGHLFHIDFGRLFGDAEKIAGVRRDRVPFVFTDSMAMLIAGGQEFGQDFAEAGYRQFVDTCCLAFNLVRRRGESMLLSAVKTLRFPAQNLQYLKDCLMLHLSDSEASSAFERMIKESLKSVAPQFNFWIHSIAQSFVKQPPSLPLLSTYSKLSQPFDALTVPTDSLLYAEVTHFHKVRYPIKHYMFQISVYPEQVTNLPLTAGGGALLIFRRFSEVNDLREGLIAEFSLLAQQIAPFKTRGATENRDTARKRMAEINAFFETLFGLSLEIRRSKAVEKFFKVRPMDLRSASGFIRSVNAVSLPQDGELWMTLTIRNPESPLLEVFVHGGLNIFYDENCATGRVRVTLLVEDSRPGSSFSVEEPSKFRTDTAPPGSQPLFNKLFVWKLPEAETWPAELFLIANAKVHPTNAGGLISEERAKLFGTVRIALTKMVSWAKSWPIRDSQCFKLVREDRPSG